MTKKIVVAGTAVALSLGAGTAAFAYFTQTGTANGYAAVGTPAGWSVLVQTPATQGGPLTPGAGAEQFNYSVTNNSNGDVQLNTVTAQVVSNGGMVEDAGNGNAAVSGCDASWFTAVPTTPASPVSVPAGQTYTGTVVVSMTNAPYNQNACEGVQPVFTVTAN
jgi:hypothetical protein